MIFRQKACAKAIKDIFLKAHVDIKEAQCKPQIKQTYMYITIPKYVLCTHMKLMNVWTVWLRIER